jgi:hypothetical protein
MMLGRHGFVPRGPKPSPSDDPSEWRLVDLAKELDMPVVTMYGSHSRGSIKTRRVNGQWVAIADKAELRRLRQVRQENTSYHRADGARSISDNQIAHHRRHIMRGRSRRI